MIGKVKGHNELERLTLWTRITSRVSWLDFRNPRTYYTLPLLRLSITESAIVPIFFWGRSSTIQLKINPISKIFDSNLLTMRYNMLT